MTLAFALVAGWVLLCVAGGSLASRGDNELIGIFITSVAGATGVIVIAVLAAAFLA